MGCQGLRVLGVFRSRMLDLLNCQMLGCSGVKMLGIDVWGVTPLIFQGVGC